jgi:hypothetical protein
MAQPNSTQSEPERRRERRQISRLRVSTTAIDPVRDPVTGATYYESSDDSSLINLSRRGVCLRSPRPPPVATRLILQIHVPGENRPIELVGRTCWGRIEHEPGQVGARAVAAVGIEVVGGSSRDLDRYDRTLAELETGTEPRLQPPSPSDRIRP